MQRLFDIMLSSIALFILTPLLIPIMIILSFTGEQEVFYIQSRVGRGGKIFGLYKFATMLKNSPNIGSGELTLSNDPRILYFGRFLRKTKLNELPQLWNILTGEMSIVGPRPMVPNTYKKYSKEVRRKLNTIRPGLTGIGSIIFRDEEKYLDGKSNPKKFYDTNIIPYKSALEIWYVENRTLTIYFIVIYLTAYVILYPSSRISHKFFSSLPKLPKELEH